MGLRPTLSALGKVFQPFHLLCPFVTGESMAAAFRSDEIVAALIGSSAKLGDLLIPAAAETLLQSIAQRRAQSFRLKTCRGRQQHRHVRHTG